MSSAYSALTCADSARIISRVTTRDLRVPVLILTSVRAMLNCCTLRLQLSLIWLVWTSVGYLRSIGDTGETAKLRLFDILLGALLLALAAVEAFGLFAVSTVKLPLLRTYAWLASVGAVVMLGVEILRLVLHFVLKSDLIGQCVTVNAPYYDGTGSTDSAFSGSRSFGTAADLQNDCNSAWTRGIYVDIAWYGDGLAEAALTDQAAAGQFRRLRAGGPRYCILPPGSLPPPSSFDSPATQSSDDAHPGAVRRVSAQRVRPGGSALPSTPVRTA